MPEPVRVRFAPSPTGHLHVGGARTALFNWAFARHHQGVFILRVEDTDRSRSTEEYIESILEALAWLGLDWDEGPPTAGYRQTERLEIYKAQADRLLGEGRAYRCRCTAEALDALRREAQQCGETFRYPGTCRDLAVPASEPSALRLRIAAEGETVVEDAIHGRVTFDHAQLDDWILVRSDGTPTYNFCVVVDDVTMQITHVIRGNDHLSNTPKQIQCYAALGYPLPLFAHIPMILGPDRSRLSKRHGATSVQAFRDAGIVPEAMLNYLARLGWSHGDQEIFSREDIARHFDLAQVGQAAAIFDRAKLEWLSMHWIKQAPPERLAAQLAPFLARAGLPVPPDRAWLGRVTETLTERSHTLVEMAEKATFYVRPPAAYDPQATARFWTVAAHARYALLIKRLEAQADLDPATVEALYRELAAQLGLKLVDLAQLTRIAITGTTVSPPIFQVVSLLGKAETLARLKAALAAAGARS
ncbi:MAG: glutamate--tRNA ligase [Candidatus Rokubacteria bacterium GWC2_70_16]|nr:MAG: glutamate--tRNA ligase [Candidatus Rokubacteria bacterium GWC2_70_16]OGL19222.1 MAG: glutamate--tRNA ligase [Candidatus Rokubacteria bacterium RIFCSPLOWO2_12_FULL_71_19]